MVGIFPFIMGAAGMSAEAVEKTCQLLALPLMFLFGIKGYTMVKDSGGSDGAAAFAAIGSAVMGWLVIGAIHLAIREPGGARLKPWPVQTPRWLRPAAFEPRQTCLSKLS